MFWELANGVEEQTLEKWSWQRTFHGNLRTAHISLTQPFFCYRCHLNMMMWRHSSASSSLMAQNTSNSGCIKPWWATLSSDLGCKLMWEHILVAVAAMTGGHSRLGSLGPDKPMHCFLHWESLAMRKIPAELNCVLTDVENYDLHGDECIELEIILFIMWQYGNT